MTDEPVTPATDPVSVGNNIREPTGYEQSLRTQLATAKEQLRTATARIAELGTTHTTALAQQKTDLTAATADRIIKAKLHAHAVKAGLVDMDAIKLLDLSAVKLNDADGLDGVDELFAAAKVAKPYLFGVPGTPLAPSTTPAAPSTSSTATPPGPAAPAPKHASAMTPAELAAEFSRLGVRLPG